MNIEVLSLSEVEDAHYNPRRALRPGDPEWKQIEASLEEFGLVEPLVYNRSTGRLVAGHQRKRILEHQGVREAPFSVVELDPEREKALNIALNRGGEWDQEKLADLLVEIRETDYLPPTGFDSEEIDRLLEAVELSESASFLDAVIDEAERATPAPVGDSSPDRGERGARYFPLSFSVTEEQRTEIHRALRLAKDQHECSSIEALVHIARAYVATSETDG